MFLAVKQERFDESGFVALAAWITCDLSLMISAEELEELISSSSEEELDEDVLDVSSLSESESGACCALVTSEQICLGQTLVAASVKVEGLQL